FSENNIVVFRKKGMALFSLVANYEKGKIEVSERNFHELIDYVKCSFEEKRLTFSKQFWRSYEKIKGYKPQYKSGSSELSIEKKAANSLKSLLKHKRDELNKTHIDFIGTLLKDIKHYKTLSINTLRKLVLSEKTNRDQYNELIQNIENLQRRIGSDYLNVILKRTTNINDDIIIAIENKTSE
ncbi:helicase, partial [candidate division KSB1 bacterium]